MEKIPNKTKQECLKELKQFIIANKHLAKQGTKDWLEQRKLSIGGSEMSIITGDNKYWNADIPNLVARKVGLAKFQGNIHTRWGKLLEEITNKITKILFVPNGKIYETGSVEGAVENHRYSPDGLAVIKYKYKVNGKKIKRYITTLLEYKAPSRSFPDGKIPQHYLPQIKSGMCDIPITNISLFVNNMFRKCSITELDSSDKYDYIFHKPDVEKNKVAKPVAIGFIGFYLTPEQIINMEQLYEEFLENKSTDLVNEFCYSDSDSDSEDSDSEDDDEVILREYKFKKHKFIMDSSVPLLEQIIACINYNFTVKNNKNNGCKLLDLGEASLKIMSDFLLFLEDRNNISVKYYEPQIIKGELKNNIYPNELNYIYKKEYKEINFDKKLNTFKNKCLENNYIPIGVFPWKLIKSDNILEHKEPSYLKTHSPKINETIKIVSDILNSETIEDKFLEYFPNKTKIVEYYHKSIEKNIKYTIDDFI